MDTGTSIPQTSVDWIKKNSYAIIIVLLIALIAFMLYPNNTIYLLLGLLVPILIGIGVESLFQTDYYKSLNYQLSRLEKTIIVSAAVGASGLAMGYFSERIIDGLGALIDMDDFMQDDTEH